MSNLNKIIRIIFLVVNKENDSILHDIFAAIVIIYFRENFKINKNSKKK